MVSAERLRLDEADTGGLPWQRWGPYLGERQWGTVREDYGSGDNTWSCFPREQVLLGAATGIGASHQTGWTGTAALLPLLFRGVSAEALRTGGRGALQSAAAGRRTGAAR